MKHHHLFLAGPFATCTCKEWVWSEPKLNWGPMLQSYALHRPDLKDAVAELLHWQRGTDATNFTSGLYSLIHKADMGNMHRLQLGFPLEVEAWTIWVQCSPESAFFDAWLGES